MRIKYTYTSYPNCPRATKYSHSREKSTAILGAYSGLFSIIAIMLFFAFTFSLFEEGNWGSFFIGFIIINLVALWDLYIIVLRNNNTECKLNIILIEEALLEEDDYEESEYLKQQIVILKKENKINNMQITKKYFLYFYLGLLAAIAIVGIIQGIISAFN